MTPSADVDLHALLEHVPAIVYVAHSDGTIAFGNAAWERFTGLPVQTLLEHGWADVLHADDAARVAKRAGVARFFSGRDQLLEFFIE